MVLQYHLHNSLLQLNWFSTKALVVTGTGFSMPWQSKIAVVNIWHNLNVNHLAYPFCKLAYDVTAKRITTKTSPTYRIVIDMYLKQCEYSCDLLVVSNCSLSCISLHTERESVLSSWIIKYAANFQKRPMSDCQLST